MEMVAKCIPWQTRMAKLVSKDVRMTEKMLEMFKSYRFAQCIEESKEEQNAALSSKIDMCTAISMPPWDSCSR